MLRPSRPGGSGLPRARVAMLAATLALIGGVQVLAPASAAAMDDLDELSECREDEDFFLFEIEEDCSDEESGGGDPGGGEPSGGGGSSDGGSADDLCANYGVNCSGGSGDSGGGPSGGSGSTPEPPPGCVDYAWGQCLDNWEDSGADPTRGPDDDAGGDADPCGDDRYCGGGGRGSGGGGGGGGGAPSGPSRPPSPPPNPCAGYSRAFIDTLYPHPTPEQDAENTKAYEAWRRCIEDTPRGSTILGRAGRGMSAAARLATVKRASGLRVHWANGSRKHRAKRRSGAVAGLR